MVVQVRESARAAEEEEVGFRSRPVSLFFFYFPSPLKKDQQQLQERKQNLKFNNIYFTKSRWRALFRHRV